MKLTNRFKVAANFYLDEFVPKGLYEKHSTDELLKFIDNRIFTIAQTLRDNLQATMTVNNWAINGNRNWSGIRTPDSPYYSPKSRHTLALKDGAVTKVCDAFDCVFGGLDARIARQHILENQKLYLELGVRRLEGRVYWLHLDLMPTGFRNIHVFNP